MSENIIKKMSKFGESISDRFIDAVQRWWWVVSLIVSAYGTYAGRATTLINRLTWVEAILFGVVLSLAVMCFMLVAVAAYRKIRDKPVPLRDRKEFLNEIVDVRELMEAGEEGIQGRHFRRCILTGAGQMRLTHSTIIWISLKSQSIKPVIGQVFSGSPLFVQCTFDRCFFDGSIIEPINWDIEECRIETIQEWKLRRWE